MAVTYKIAKWDETFETSESRKLKAMKWVALPANLDSNGYQSLVEEYPEKAAALYGAWCALLAVAAGCPVRGTLAASNGRPFTTRRIASLTHLPEGIVSELLEWASSPEIGWIESDGMGEECSKTLGKTQSPGVPADSPGNPLEFQEITGKKPGLHNSTGQDTTGQDRTQQNNSSELASPPAEPVSDDSPAFPDFPTVGRKNGPRVWTLSKETIWRLQEAYPGVDVEAQCRQAHSWCVTNPTRRKTASGMDKFLNAWCARQQNAGGGARAGPKTFAQMRLENSSRAIDEFANG